VSQKGKNKKREEDTRAERDDMRGRERQSEKREGRGER